MLNLSISIYVVDTTETISTKCFVKKLLSDLEQSAPIKRRHCPSNRLHVTIRQWRGADCNTINIILCMRDEYEMPSAICVVVL